MKRFRYTLFLLLFCQMSFSQFIVYESEETPSEKGFAFAKCRSILDEADLDISCSLSQGRKVFHMDFYFDDLCMDNKQQIVISYKIGDKYSQYTLTITDYTSNYGVYDGAYGFIDFKSGDNPVQGIYIAGLKNNEKFWQDLRAASRMCLKIGETNECDDVEVVFNLEGSTKAYNYLKDHPSQPTIIHYHK